jgi:hypothetical protein
MSVDRKSLLILLIVQAILCGLFIATFTHCLRWLMFADEGWKYRKTMKWPMSIVTIIISTLALTTLGLTVKMEFRYLRGNTYVALSEAFVRVRMPEMFG